MGMDVYGTKPSDPMGEYFRNSVWGWRPLWNYCEAVAPHLTAKVNGHTNDGDGLNAEAALELGILLANEIDTGKTHSYKLGYDEFIAKLPEESCKICNGTGIRTDSVGVRDRQHLKQIINSAHPHIAGKTHPRFGQIGWCNGCDGVGKRPHFMANYPFRVDNVAEFAGFLKHCGGFKIW